MALVRSPPFRNDAIAGADKKDFRRAPNGVEIKSDHNHGAYPKRTKLERQPQRHLCKRFAKLRRGFSAPPGTLHE